MQALARSPQTARRPSSIRTIVALMLREISMTNGRSILGYLWEIVIPVVAIVLFTLIAGAFFRSPPIGSNFALFYASGILPFNFAIEIVTRVSGSVRFSRPLLNYPNVTFLHALLARFLIAAITKSLVFALVLYSIVTLYGLSTYFDYRAVLVALALAFLLGLAVGSFNCLVTSFVPTYERVWQVLTRPLFLFSAVLYLFESVPLPYRDWLWWNPAIHLVGLMRRGLYPTYDAAYVSVTYLVSIILVLLPVSFFFMQRYWREMLEAT